MLQSPRSRGPSPKRPALSGSASFEPSGAFDPTDADTAHPVLHPGRVAVITGAASGIGAAAARELAALGMKIALADLPAALPALTALAADLADLVGEANVLVVPTDVRVLADIVRLRDTVYETWHEVGVLMNNAGVGGEEGTSLDNLSAWHAVFATNVLGVVAVQQTFVGAMLHQENPAMVINTGSKQGVTNPPGNTAYNASKAAVKSLTEGLAHELRTRAAAGGAGSVSAHLFVRLSSSSFFPRPRPLLHLANPSPSPGWTYTGLTGAHSGGAKPAGAWTAQETVRHMLARVAAGEFYVLCPDNETGPEIDQLRIMWAAADVAQGRPALSRWHRDYKALYEEYIREGQALASEGALML
ncbi:hypothetical protein B0H17DRAFT_942950 [Mycena rosella]|uniref:Ketoreductase domain-containing protein n=1 Tax=Mycena rosella TaxID=1033263 RepID=A0AAD7GDL3_MYCRO|nr:hypothetical protein B0H17DRAFT_942950 [Mycena rosella]